MQAASPEPSEETQASAYAPEQSVLVASLLSMSGGFLDAFTWVLLGRVLAGSQTGNVVLLAIYSTSGQWRQASHHLLPIVGFLVGASVAIRIRAPLLCLVGEIVCLTAVMLLLHRVPGPVAILGISFGTALQSASFRQVERWKYLSVAVTGNMFRAVDQFAATSDREALDGAGVMIVLCLMFLLGAAVGSCVTMRLGVWSLAVPIASSVCVILLCCRDPRHPHRS
jgi:uncharacterized membrane protein YoaK (UPF0700 family)